MSENALSMLMRFQSIWTSEKIFLVRLKNIGHLLTGNFTSSFIGLIGFTLTARSLGPTDYGVLALAFAYARGVERFVSFRSWQPLIKYGAERLAADDLSDLKALFKFGLLLDIFAACVAWAIAVTLVLVAGPLFGISAEMRNIVILYCTVLPFQFSGMSIAVLRLFGRYHVLAYGQVVGSFLRLLLCLLGALAGWNLHEFLLIWMGSQILGSLNMTFLAFLELRKRGIHGVLREPLRGISQRLPGLFRFSLSSNLSLTVRSSAYELDTLIVGYLTDPASAGLYHIAKRIGHIAQQAGGQVQAVLFPDLVRAWSGKDTKDFRKTVVQTQIMLMTFGLAALIFFYFTIGPVLRWTAGADFVGAAPLVIVQTIAVMMTLCGTVLYSALLAMGLERAVLLSVLVATAMFHATAFLLVPRIGPMGANIAHIVMSSVLLVGMTYVYRKNLYRK